MYAIQSNKSLQPPHQRLKTDFMMQKQREEKRRNVFSLFYQMIVSQKYDKFVLKIRENNLKEIGWRKLLD